jgi:hypothetical protein
MNSLGIYSGLTLSAWRVNNKSCQQRDYPQSTVFAGDFKRRSIRPEDNRVIKDALRTNHISAEHGSYAYRARTL